MGERPGSLGRGPRNAVVIVARVLTYVTLLSLLASTFVLAVMLKGARQAHMNLWERLVEQEKKTDDVYQEMAGHKVILVDQEEKANSATRDLNHCQGILESRDQELKESRSHIEELAKDVEMYRTSIVDYKDELKRKVAANNALAKKLGIAQKQIQKLEQLYNEELVKSEESYEGNQVDDGQYEQLNGETRKGAEKGQQDIMAEVERHRKQALNGDRKKQEENRVNPPNLLHTNPNLQNGKENLDDGDGTNHEDIYEEALLAENDADITDQDDETQ